MGQPTPIAQSGSGGAVKLNEISIGLRVFIADPISVASEGTKNLYGTIAGQPYRTARCTWKVPVEFPKGIIRDIAISRVQKVEAR